MQSSGVRVVEVGAAVEVVLAATSAPAPGSPRHAVEDRGQECRAFATHRRVDDLAAAGLVRPVAPRARRRVSIVRSAAVVGDEVQWRNGWFVGPPDGIQDTAERDVVDVVTGLLRLRPGLAPTRHAAVDQARMALRTVFGSKPEPLHHAGPEAFLIRMSAACASVNAALRPSVERRSSAIRQPAAAGHVVGVVRCVRSCDLNDFGTQVRQHHRAKGHRASMPPASSTLTPASGSGHRRFTSRSVIR